MNTDNSTAKDIFSGLFSKFTKMYYPVQQVQNPPKMDIPDPRLNVRKEPQQLPPQQAPQQNLPEQGQQQDLPQQEPQQIFPQQQQQQQQQEQVQEGEVQDVQKQTVEYQQPDIPSSKEEEEGISFEQQEEEMEEEFIQEEEEQILIESEKKDELEIQMESQRKAEENMKKTTDLLVEKEREDIQNQDFEIKKQKVKEVIKILKNNLQTFFDLTQKTRSASTFGDMLDKQGIKLFGTPGKDKKGVFYYLKEEHKRYVLISLYITSRLKKGGIEKIEEIVKIDNENPNFNVQKTLIDLLIFVYKEWKSLLESENIKFKSFISSKNSIVTLFRNQGDIPEKYKLESGDFNENFISDSDPFAFKNE